MSQRSFDSPDAETTKALAGRLALAVREFGPPSTVIGLTGDLGAGKTTFAQGFVAALAPDRDIYVTSPTFAIAQCYDTEPTVWHLDLYRLGDIDELEAIGYREMFYEPGIALVEWIDRVPEAVPTSRLDVRLCGDGEDGRTIVVAAHGDAMVRVLAHLGPNVAPNG